MLCIDAIPTIPFTCGPQNGPAGEREVRPPLLAISWFNPRIFNHDLAGISSTHAIAQLEWATI